jgi:hypothetical protein
MTGGRSVLRIEEFQASNHKKGAIEKLAALDLDGESVEFLLGVVGSVRT